MKVYSILNVFLAIFLSPLLFGVINRTKAFFAGRRGQPLLQAYYDLIKLFRKGAVYSNTTTWVFRAGPVVGLAAAFLILFIAPLGGVRALVAFPGDFVLFAYLLGLVRFITVLASLDTGSAFEGMGASREVWLSCLAEPALLIGLGALAFLTKGLSLSDIYAALNISRLPIAAYPAIFLIAVAFLIVFLTENSRIPFDDPNTHLELTMIHEVMFLDHGGIDFGLIQYTSALKHWIIGSLLAGFIIPFRTGPLFDSFITVAGIFILAVIVGVIESTMARLRLTRLPQLLVTASILTILAFMLLLR